MPSETHFWLRHDSSAADRTQLVLRLPVLQKGQLLTEVRVAKRMKHYYIYLPTYTVTYVVAAARMLSFYIYY